MKLSLEYENEKVRLIQDSKSDSGLETSDLQKDKPFEIVRTWRHWTITVIVTLYFFGNLASFFALIEFTKEYVKEEEYHKANLSLSNTSSPCDSGVPKIVTDTEERVSSRASEWSMYYSLASGIPAIISSLVFGAYTDTFGRKFLLTICLSGLFLRLLISGIVIYFDAHLVYLLIANFVEGCSGIHATCIIVSLAYAADITSPGGDRMTSMILVEFVIGISLTVGSFCSGYMVEALGYHTSIFINSGFIALAIILTLLILPETLRPEYRQKDRFIANVLKTVVHFFVGKEVVGESANSRWKYQIVIVCLFLTNISFIGQPSVLTLYVLAEPFCWSPTEVGVYSSVRALSMMFIGLGALKVLGRWFDDVTLCMLGNLSYGAAFFWTAFVEDDLSIYLVIVVTIFGLASTTMQRNILSHLTPAEKQGAIFTVVGILEVVTSLISNVSNSAIYAATVSYMRGFAFLVMGSYNVVALLLTLILKVGWYREKQRTQFQK